MQRPARPLERFSTGHLFPSSLLAPSTFLLRPLRPDQYLVSTISSLNCRLPDRLGLVLCRQSFISSIPYPSRQTRPMSDRTSSATFRVGFPSPSSPSVGYLKENDQPYISSDHFPQTPTSPPLMSVSAQSHATYFAPSQTSPRQATSQSADYSSLPPSDPMSSQISQQPTLSSTTTSFPTPASSVSGHLVDADKLTGTGMQESGSTVTADANLVPTQTPPEHTQTDHDRNMGGADPGTRVRDSANMDAMEIDNNDNSGSSNNEGAASSENNGFSLDSLQREFTSAYHLCKSCKSFSPISILIAVHPAPV